MEKEKYVVDYNNINKTSDDDVVDMKLHQQKKVSVSFDAKIVVSLVKNIGHCIASFVALGLMCLIAGSMGIPLFYNGNIWDVALYALPITYLLIWIGTGVRVSPMFKNNRLMFDLALLFQLASPGIALTFLSNDKGVLLSNVGVCIFFASIFIIRSNVIGKQLKEMIK